VIYKLGLDGKGTLIRRKDFGKIKDFRNWTDSKFRHMCILSGCDYLDSPKGIGLKKAQQLLMKTDGFKLIKSWLAWGKNLKAPPLVEDYLMKFQMAEWTFLHQTVYDPQLKKCIHWNPIKDPKLLNLDNLDFLGRYIFNS
jgi:exonuclease-1